MQEEKAEHREEEGSKVNRASSGVGDPSLEEEQPAEEKSATPDEDGSQSADEDAEKTEPVPHAADEVQVEEKPPQRRGCLVGCITPIAVALAIVLVIVTIVYSKRDALSHGLLKRIINNTQNNVLRAQGINEKQVTATFEEVKLALKERRIDKEALAEAIEEYWDAVGKRPPSEQAEEEITKLMESLGKLIKQISP